MFCNIKMFISKYSRQSLLKIIISIFAVIVFYCLKTYYAVILTFIGSETLMSIALFSKGVLLYVFGHISVIFQIFFLNILIRTMVSLAILSFAVGVCILYQFATCKIINAIKKTQDQKPQSIADFLNLQQSYLFNLRLIN